ncbi:MAG: DUF222 domain-containing protein [Gordonia sp. (in: high G+C Gram-positive bacteria)]|uniref:HNH endonuclease signature motif containing protein n=1 Tax=Gordonia sp. (in: high G+C Gram-positive bacteria) TaxID=84139 RepID=UPI0039E2F083
MVDDEFDAPALLADLTPRELVAVIEAAEEHLAVAPLSRESEDGLLTLLESRERAHCKGVAVDAALHVELSDRAAYTRAGYRTMHQLLTQGLRIGEGRSRQRRTVATVIGRFTSLTGEPLAPEYPATAVAVADGAIGADHVSAIDEVMDKIPHSVAPDRRAQAESMLADAARTLNPASVGMVGNRILAHLDPDGTLEDETDRARRSTLALSPQDRRLMSRIRGFLAPELRAEFEVFFDQWAVPGMNNPADPDSPSGAVGAPGVDPAVVAAAAERDERLLGRRQHDAVLAMVRWVNAQIAEARPDGLRSQVVITVTDEDLARQAGVAWTATGTRLPIADLVKYAATAVPYLAVFAEGTSQVLHLGRGSRLASRAQRLALFARDRGCTAPGCTHPFSRTQAHHMPDWADGGPTDIDRLGAACGRHNRWNGKNPGRWESMVLGDDAGANAGRVGWRPAGREGPWIVNPLFHPEKLATALVDESVGESTRGDRSSDAPSSPAPTPPPVVNHRLGDSGTDSPPEAKRTETPPPGTRRSSSESGAETLVEQLLAA